MRYLQREVANGQCEFPFELDPTNYKVGSTWLDYLNGYWIPMSEAQCTFSANNPTASAKEIFDMQLVVVEEPELTVEEQNEAIRRQREASYRRESDSLYMAYMKYSEMGETEKAAAAKAAWLAKIQEIDMRLPYVTEG